MKNLYARESEENCGIHPAEAVDDRDAESPPRFTVKQRVHVYLNLRGWRSGWVEVVELGRVGVRLVNGNFRWCDPSTVKPDGGAVASDLFGEGRP